jgi:hypothetical protein
VFDVLSGFIPTFFSISSSLRSSSCRTLVPLEYQSGPPSSPAISVSLRWRGLPVESTTGNSIALQRGTRQTQQRPRLTRKTEQQNCGHFSRRGGATNATIHSGRFATSKRAFSLRIVQPQIRKTENRQHCIAWPDYFGGERW